MNRATVRIRLGDLPGMTDFLDSVAALLLAIADMDRIPDPVMDAADEVRKAIAGMGGRDIGPPP